MDPLLVSINDAAQMLSLGRTSVYGLIKDGRLATVKMGRRTLVRVDSIRRVADNDNDE
jgi:excisionase family DNA binding protein